LFGARLLSGAIADLLSTNAPEQALTWRRGQPEALERVAAARHESADAAATYAVAQRALDANPLDGRAYRVLALLAQDRGDAPQARELMQLAARRSPRDFDVRTLLLRSALADGRIDDALSQIDVMLRVDPETGKDLYPVLASATEDPQAVIALAAVLSAAPPWRAAFWV